MFLFVDFFGRVGMCIHLFGAPFVRSYPLHERFFRLPFVFHHR